MTAVDLMKQSIFFKDDLQSVHTSDAAMNGVAQVLHDRNRAHHVMGNPSETKILCCDYAGQCLHFSL